MPIPQREKLYSLTGAREMQAAHVRGSPTEHSIGHVLQAWGDLYELPAVYISQHLESQNVPEVNL